MATFVQQLAGKAGSAINQVGKALGNPLPERNFSESLQNFGGNKSGQQFVYVPPRPQATSGSGQVQGASTVSYGNQNVPIPAGFNPGSSSGYSSGYSSSSVGSTPPMVSSGVQGGDTGAFDGLLNDAISTLEGGIGAAESAYGAAKSGIEANIGKQVGQAQTNLNATNQGLEQRAGEAKQGTANAVNEARRGYSEIAQGLQSRYGGSTGTGGFAESIVGGQTQRNVAGFQQQLATSLQKIGDTKTQVKLLHDQLLQDLDTQKQSFLAEAKSQFDNTLQRIREAKSALQAQKADWTRQAIMEYQAQANRANEIDTQFKQNLYQQQIAAQQRLDAAAASQQQKASQLQILYGKNSVPIGAFNPNQNQTVQGVAPYGFMDINTPGYIMERAGQLNNYGNEDDDLNIPGLTG